MRRCDECGEYVVWSGMSSDQHYFPLYGGDAVFHPECCPGEVAGDPCRKCATDGTTEPGHGVHGDGTPSIYPEYLFP